MRRLRPVRNEDLPRVACPTTMPMQLMNPTTGKVYWQDLTWKQVHDLLAHEMAFYDQSPKAQRDRAKLLAPGGRTHPYEIRDLMRLDPTIKLRDLLDLDV